MESRAHTKFAACVLNSARFIEMDAILQADFSSVRAPLGGDKVYKDECIYSFQTPVSCHDVMLT